MPTVTAAPSAALHNPSHRMNHLSNDAANNNNNANATKEESAALQAILSLNKSADDSLDGIFLNSTSPTANSNVNANVSSHNQKDVKGSDPSNSNSSSSGNVGKTTTTTIQHKSQPTLVSVISKDSSCSGSSVSGSTTITTTTSSTSASTNMSLSTTSAANKRKHGSAFSAAAASSSSSGSGGSSSVTVHAGSSSSGSVGTNGNASLSSYRPPPPPPHSAAAYGHPSMHPPPPPHAYYAHPYAPPPPHPASYPNHYHMHYGHPYYPAPNAYHAYPPTAQPPPPPHPSYGYTSQGTVHSYGVAPPPSATVMNASTGAATTIVPSSHAPLEKDAKKKSSISSSSTSTAVVTAVKSSNHVKSSSTSSHKESKYSNHTHHGSNTNAVSIGSTTTASSSSTSSHVRSDDNHIKNIKKKNAVERDMNLNAPRCASTTTFNTSPIASLNVIKASIGSSTKDSSSASNNDKTKDEKDPEERIAINGPHYKLNDSADTSSSSINLNLNGTFTPLPMSGGGKKSSSKSHSSSSRGHSSLLSPNFQILEGCLSWSVGNPSTVGSASSTGRSMLSSIDRRDDISLGALTSSSKKKKSRGSGSDGSRESWRHTFSPYAQAACHGNAAQNSPMVGSRGVLNTSTESENTTQSEPKELTSKTPMAVKKPIKTQPKVASTPGYSPYYNAMATPGSNLFSPHPSSFPFSPYLFTPGAPPLPAVSESSNGNERVRNLRGNISFSRSVPYPNAMASPLVAPAYPYSSNNTMHSRNGAKCYALKHPLPNKFEGDIERNSSRTPPDFSNLVNFPPSAATSSGLGRNSGDNNGATISKICVMCGKMCPVSQGKKSRASLQHKAQQQAANTGASHLQPTPIIPSQNKGLCTSCDVNVWVVMDSACSRHPDLLQIKWCKGCKNFRPWASFGEKGLATKCVRCRDRQREKYALQKKEKEVNKVLSRAQQHHCS